MSTKVRYGPVPLTLDVPDGDELLAWAAAPHQRQAAHGLYRDSGGGSGAETLRLQATCCVRYHERFMRDEA